MVQAYLDSPNDNTWRKFRTAYLTLLEKRFREDRAPFDQSAALAMAKDVFIGCSCPTNAGPRIDRCHTFLALELVKSRYRNPQLEFPPVDD